MGYSVSLNKRGSFLVLLRCHLLSLVERALLLFSTMADIIFSFLLCLAIYFCFFFSKDILNRYSISCTYTWRHKMLRAFSPKTGVCHLLQRVGNNSIPYILYLYLFVSSVTRFLYSATSVLIFFIKLHTVFKGV